MDEKIIDTEKTVDNDFLQYDSIEDINNCLNCQKDECNNCLRFRNGV